MTPKPLPAVLPGIVHVVDDDDAFRTAISRVLTAAGHRPKLYASAPEYLASNDPEGPACVVLDLRMPGVTGLDLQSALARRDDAHPVIFLSGHGDIPAAVAAMKAGAVDFFEKPYRGAALMAVVRRAIDRDIQQRALHAEHQALLDRFESLTADEKDVLDLTVAGKPDKAIALKLDLSLRTIQLRRASVMRKMNAHSRAELIRLAQTIELAAAQNSG